MSVETRDQAGGDNGEGGANSNVNDLENLKKEIDALKKHNQELLGEKKGALSKVAQFEKEKAELEEKAAQEKGEFKSLFEKERERNLAIAAKTKARVFDSQIKDALRSIGCTDEKKLEKLMQFSSVKNYQDKVTFDDDYNADKEKLSAFASEIKKEFSDLGFFATQAPNTKDVNPAGGEPPSVDLSKLTVEQKVDLLQKAMNKNQTKE